MGGTHNGAQNRSLGDPVVDIGWTIRSARRSRALTLQALADDVGCAKSYLSSIENGRRDSPPSEPLLARLEAALGLEGGRLVQLARWQNTPPEVKREVVELQRRREAARELAMVLAAAQGASGSNGSNGHHGRASGHAHEPGATPGGRPMTLDELHASGRLRALIERIDPDLTSAITGEPAASGPDGGGAHPCANGAAVPRRAGAEGSVLALLPVEVPLINSVAAGYPTEFTDLGYPARVADEYVRAPQVHDPDAFAARVVGDSMEPKYLEGDVVIFSPARAVEAGMDCFARLEPDHETTFKRVYFERGDGGANLVRLQPLNSRYAARVLPREQVAGLYAAVSVIRAV